jgi:hypothetical protein
MASYNSEIQKAWNNAKPCFCKDKDCGLNAHRLCVSCNKKMLYGSNSTNLTQINSKYAWKINLNNKKVNECMHVNCIIKK